MALARLILSIRISMDPNCVGDRDVRRVMAGVKVGEVPLSHRGVEGAISREGHLSGRDVARALAEAGASLDARNVKGETPLDLADAVLADDLRRLRHPPDKQSQNG